MLHDIISTQSSFSSIINTIIKDIASETSQTGSTVASTHLDSDLLQQEVDGPVDVPIAVVKGHHTLILIFACNLHELGQKHKQIQSNTYRYNKTSILTIIFYGYVTFWWVD